jgi:ABC-2 type transport system permease protein
VRALGKSLVRITSFIFKEIRELIRRPGIILSLILGPFLIMALFGVGYTGSRAPFDTLVVVPPETDLPTDVEYYREISDAQLNVVDVIEDVDEARRRLASQEVGLLVIAPKNPAEQLRNGQQSVVTVEWNIVDPVRDSLAQFATNTLVSEINAEVIRRAAEQGITIANEDAPEPITVPPETIAKPTRAETANIAPTAPTVIGFFGPAVFALVLQHLAVTLTAMSMVRERLSGTMDVYRVAPLTSMELLVGKYVAYAVFSLVISAIVAALLIGVLGVPLLGGWVPFVGVVLLLTFASLGVGLLISLIADSERQAVQLSMIVLLASVFFSGFVLPVEEFLPAVRYVAYALPVTHGIETLQQTMLRGEISSTWMLWALAGIGALLYLFSLLRLRRIMRRAD